MKTQVHPDPNVSLQPTGTFGSVPPDEKFAASGTSPLRTEFRRVASRAAATVLYAGNTAWVWESFSNSGYQALWAKNCADALKMVSIQQVDIVLIEKDLSCSELVQNMRRDGGKELYIAVVECNSSAKTSSELGADDLILLPPNRQGVVARIDSIWRLLAACRRAVEATAQADQLHMFAAEAAALLAHDLNNGLAVAAANLEYVEDEAGLKDDLALAMRSACESLEKMTTLASNFVDISRIEEASLQVALEDTCIETMLASVARLHETSSREKDGRYHVDCPAGFCGFIDPALIERVLHNLVGNASRYVSDGGQVDISAQNSDCGNWLEILVSNDGPSIPAERHATLFDKYSTGDKRSVRGMGLYFVRLACEAHGGSISLCQKSGRTTFVVRLPVVERTGA